MSGLLLAVGGSVATFPQPWYMLCLIISLLFGAPTTQSLLAPAIVFMPQVILIDGILIFLLFPKLLLGSVSDNEQIFGYKGHGGYTASTASLGDATLGAKSVVNGI